MEKDVVFIEGSESVADAVKTMLEKQVWSLVVTKAELPVGFVSERDIMRRCFAKDYDPKFVKVESVMSSPLVTIEPDAPLAKVMTLMVEKGIRRVYIVEGGKIIGRITQTGAFAEMFRLMMTLSAVI